MNIALLNFINIFILGYFFARGIDKNPVLM